MTTPAQRGAPDPAGRAAPDGGGAERTHALKGMRCAACAASIEKGLARLPGVESVSVSYAAGTATLSGDVSEDAVLAEVKRLGYEALPSSEPPPLPGADDGRPARRAAQIAVPLCAATLAVEHLAPAGWMPVALGLALLTLAWPGRRIFAAAARGALARHAGMDTLVALGAGAAFLHSAWMVLSGSGDAHLPHAGLPAHGLEPAADGAAGAHIAASVMIVTFVLVGRALEESARRAAAQGLAALGRKGDVTARVVRDGAEVELPAAEVVIDDVCRIRPGEDVPADGVVTEGASGFDESLLTGEPMPVWHGVGDRLTGGTTNVGAAPVLMKASAVGSATTLSRLVRLVSEAQGRKAPVQRLADKVAGIFVPIVLLLAAATWLWSGEALHAVAVLVVACPCALGLATPAAIQAGTGRAARLGVLVRDPAALETAARLDVLVVDKTGTLTVGEPLVEGLELVDTDVVAAGGDEAAGGTAGPGSVTDDPAHKAALADALGAAAAVEVASGHPLAGAVRSEARRRGVKLPDLKPDSLEVGGGGVAGVLQDGRRVVVGSPEHLQQRALDIDAARPAIERFEKRGWSVAVVAVAGRERLVLGIADRIRPTSTRAVRILQHLGVRPIMSTGDHAAAARTIGALAGIDEQHARESPEAKADRVRALQAEGHVVGMAGDGTNDAPALAAADVGMAVGGATDLARSSAPLVLVRGDLARCTVAIELSRATLRIIRQNLALAFAYNLVALPLAATGNVSPPFAAAAMSMSSLAVVLNALRLRGFRSRMETEFGEES